MTIKVGDRVMIIYQGCNYGIKGTVVEKRYNPNMVCYGKGDEILVRLDEGKCNWIYYEKDLQIIK